MTLRTRLLVIGAIRGADGRQKVLRLGLRGRWRKRFAALLERIAALAVSTVAQFAPDQKIFCPRLGNRLRHASNHLYFQPSTEIFRINPSWPLRLTAKRGINNIAITEIPVSVLAYSSL
jgi:hypothetical protein